MNILFSILCGVLIWGAKAAVEIGLNRPSSGGGFLPSDVVNHIVLLIELITGGVSGLAIGLITAQVQNSIRNTVVAGLIVSFIVAVMQSAVFFNPYADYFYGGISTFLFQTKELWLNLPAGALTGIAIYKVRGQERGLAKGV